MRLVLGAIVELFEFYSKLGSHPMAELLRHEYRRLERTLGRWDDEARPYRKLGDRATSNGKRNVVIAFPDRAYGVAADWYEASDSELSDLLVRDARAIEAVRIHKTSETGRRAAGHARKYVRRHRAQCAIGLPEGESVPAVAYGLVAI